MKSKKEFYKEMKLDKMCTYDVEYLYNCYLLGYADGTNDERECFKEIFKSSNFPYNPLNPTFPPYPSPIIRDTTKVTCNGMTEIKGDLN